MSVQQVPVPVQAPPRQFPGTARVRRTATAAALAVAGVVGGATLFAVDPHEPGHYPTCPFLALTGWWCPGCGALRAVHDLLHLDLAGALARNPMVVLAVPYLVLALLGWARRSGGRPTPRSTSLPAWAIWLVLGAVLTFGVLRNLPGWTWLSPA